MESWSKYQQKRHKKNRQKRAYRLREAKRKGTHTAKEWNEMVLFFRGLCVCCGIHKSQLMGNSLTKDHIIPIYLGGSDSIRNLQPVCRGCNTSFGGDIIEDYRLEFCKIFEINLPNEWELLNE